MVLKLTSLLKSFYPSGLCVEALVAQMEQLNKHITEYQQQIRLVMSKHEDTVSRGRIPRRAAPPEQPPRPVH
ncbi:MAG: hypothetical protein QGF59_07530 [Pirellulaceae bacterium]|nr:hypothetical protein [Pirellulaceae bacterium]